MSKRATIAFWIIFPILVLDFTALMVFYFDLANGPLFLFILEMVAIAIFILIRILLRNKKFVIRMIPTLSLFVITGLLIAFARPTVEVKSAAYYSNPWPLKY